MDLDLGGFDKLRPAELGRAVRIANNRAAAPVKAAVVAHSESIKRFGFLAKSHRIKLRRYGEKLVAVIGPSTKYARQKGKYTRGRRAGQPRKHVPAMVAHLVEKGTARSKPKPFLRPALDAEGPRFLRAVPEQVGREIDSILSRKV